jgi:hypothetical protein
MWCLCLGSPILPKNDSTILTSTSITLCGTGHVHGRIYNRLASGASINRMHFFLFHQTNKLTLRNQTGPVFLSLPGNWAIFSAVTVSKHRADPYKLAYK